MKLNIKDKIELLDGLDVWRLKTFNKLKPFMMADGPHGMRKQSELGDNLGISGSEISVCYPTASNLAASFDKDLVKEMAETLALDAKSQDVQMILGPAINIKRNPLCGRNFEYFSEDPYLTGVLAKSYIEGVESKNIGTSVKHFFANNQEKYRFFIDSIVDDRTLHDIYLKAFKMAVKANPASIMASYNKINGLHGTEHPYINNLLRKEWNYKGVVLSDWGAVQNRVKELKAGLDLQMPSSYGYHTKIIKNNIEDDKVLRDAVDNSARRIVRMINKYSNNEIISVDLDKHHEKAIKFAEGGLVLLENKDNILPLQKACNLSLIGGFIEEMRFQGGGSSYINPYKVEQVSKVYQTYFKNAKVAKGYHLNRFDDDQTLINEALDIARKSDRVVYFMGLPERLETEGIDRDNLELPNNQLRLLDEILKVNSEVIVVLLTGSVINIPFKDKVKAILLSYLAGEGSTKAILNTLVGFNIPSGRLPETWVKSLDDLPFKINNNNNAVYYDETIYVGYRYFNTFNKEVNYPFGYGLSYAEFKYDKFNIETNNDHAIISFELENLSSFKAKEVIQIYLNQEKSKTYQAKRKLVAFDKVTLDKFEKKLIRIKVDFDEFKYYDHNIKREILESSTYNLYIANNVEDLIHEYKLTLKGFSNDKQVSNSWELFNKLTFKDIYQKALPEENILFKKPYTMDFPLEALEGSFIGRRIVNYIIKEATNELKGADSWISDNIKLTLKETPIRCIASFGSEAMSFEMAEGLVLLSNNKVFKGLKKFKEGVRILNGRKKSK